MAKIATFINLPYGHPEADARMRDIQNALPGNSFVYTFGGAENGSYPSIAHTFATTYHDADVFVGTCWPTMDALVQSTQRNIVVAGLVDTPGRIFDSRVSGLKSFDPVVLYPFWPALLAAVGKAVVVGGLKKVAVIYDQNRTGMLNQLGVIKDQFFRLGFDRLTQKSAIRADDPNNQFATNPNISGDITAFLNDVGNNPAGLIVTAGTRTTMLRDDIIAAVRARNTTASAPKLFTIYPSNIFMDISGSSAPRGALLAYGPDLRALYQKVASTYVKAIITSPPTPMGLDTNDKFSLIVGRRGAMEVGFTPPSSGMLDFKLADQTPESIRFTLAS
jgi:hypothetical protein